MGRTWDEYGVGNRRARCLAMCVLCLLDASLLPVKWFFRQIDVFHEGENGGERPKKVKSFKDGLLRRFAIPFCYIPYCRRCHNIYFRRFCYGIEWNVPEESSPPPAPSMWKPKKERKRISFSLHSTPSLVAPEVIYPLVPSLSFVTQRGLKKRVVFFVCFTIIFLFSFFFVRYDFVCLTPSDNRNWRGHFVHDHILFFSLRKTIPGPPPPRHLFFYNSELSLFWYGCLFFLCTKFICWQIFFFIKNQYESVASDSKNIWMKSWEWSVN